MKPGLFISLEGMDGSGKTTQMSLLADRLRAAGRQVVATAEPGGTGIGHEIRRILLDPAHHHLAPRAELLLYFAARAQNVAECIRPALGRNAVVLSDRFTDSTLVYQGCGRGLGEDVVRQLHEIACEGLQPDLTLFLDIDLATSRERARGRDRMEEQDRRFYDTVHSAYLRLLEENPGRMKRVDARGAVDAVAEQIWEAVRGHV